MRRFGNELLRSLSRCILLSMAVTTTDPLNALVLDAHIYSFNVCSDPQCLDGGVGEIAKSMPVVLGEIGENSCLGDFTLNLIDWAERNNIGYLAWTWNAWSVCPAEPGVAVDNGFVGPDLLLSYDGTPNAFGAQIRDRMIGAGQ